MRFELVGWPADGPKLALDYRAFSYAGKFVMSNTGKTVALAPEGGSAAEQGAAGAADEDPSERPPPATDVEGVVDPDGRVLGAVAFNADRTDPETWWLRYITVRGDRRGEGIGPRLAAFTTARLRERRAERVRIAVNNPYAYEALYRAGFAYTGEETGIAELVLARPPPDRSRATYRAGLDVFRARGPGPDERSFLDRKAGRDPPAVVDPQE
ncbi:GNAT family N-acetyltransferase [Halobacteriales archaeon QS_5_68_33]|nr:MAG: GNAT family N-acetyltransferase [Halobacteriales archaeon QS_5_68_33]